MRRVRRRSARRKSPRLLHRCQGGLPTPRLSHHSMRRASSSGTCTHQRPWGGNGGSGGVWARTWGRNPGSLFPMCRAHRQTWTTHRAITTIITFTVRVKRQSQAVLGALHEAFVAAEAPGWRGRRGLRKGESDCSYGRQHCCVCGPLLESSATHSSFTALFPRPFSFTKVCSSYATRRLLPQ